MSEAPDETQTETETPDETTPDETTPETTPDTEEEEAAEEPEQTSAQAAKAHGSASLVHEIEKANHVYIGRIQRLAGKDAQIAGCVYCQGLGFSLAGLDTGPQPIHPKNLVMCEACNGFGEVLTGSRHPDHVTGLCTKCAGNGFQTLPEVPQNVTPIYTPQPQPATPQMGFMNPDGTFTPFGVNTPSTVEQSG